VQLGKRSLKISVDGTDREAEVTSCTITSKAADAGLVTFANAAAGGTREYSLKFTAIQDPSADSLWDELWSHTGDDVDVVILPAGGTVDATHPAFTGTVTITEPDGDILGGDASIVSTDRFTFDCEWVYTAKPVRTVA
jgi:hypothetical protein